MRRLSYRSIAGNLPYHAALISADSRGLGVQRHDHDFSEWMLILSGEGKHLFRDQVEVLAPGQLWSIGRYDAHAVQGKPNSRLSYINIAFPHESWSRFAELGRIPNLPTVWETGMSSADIGTAFHESLSAFVSSPTHLDLISLFTKVCRLMASGHTSALPSWLQRGLLEMRSEESLAAGFPRLVEICSVSQEHLSRTMKSQLGVSPTDWIAERRIDAAKSLLHTTNEDIATIAYRCGFRYDTHFHKTFKLATGQTPRQYRQATARGVAP
jgi:AraC-like DNA-binding protein